MLQAAPSCWRCAQMLADEEMKHLCPVCMQTMALMVASALSTGGAVITSAAFQLRQIHAERKYFELGPKLGKGKIMFRELMPLIESRPLSITVAVLTGDLIRVNVVPQQLDKGCKVNDKIGYSNKEKIAKIPESAIYALTTPLSLTGTPEEIDESLPQALTHFAESHVRLQACRTLLMMRGTKLPKR
jgi:PRTRC genetic system protein E